MGFFKKLIRKVTKPVSKVLNKVVPNEIKPFLPYAAAFAPMFAPGMFASGAGGLGNLFNMSKFAGGALLGGGLNLGAQLAQEGNEGELNALSLLLAGAQGAGTAKNAGEKLRGFKTPKEISGYERIAGGSMPPSQGLGGLKTEYEKMISDGYNNIFYVKSKNAIGSDNEGTVDGIHFTDLGFIRYADFLIDKFVEFGLVDIK